ncbi:MAG TPA: putative toxin-antitoxin system toxin component, PIN family [Blastocatellia bacterium]|nr:putative toxin-antitoxin system toxin component, PIN family [Blastocatellia bacterium]
MPKPRIVVFDCVILVQSLISKAGPAVQCLELFEQGRFAVAVSKQTLSEVREVLGRRMLRQRYPSITDERVGDLMQLLLYRGRVFRTVRRHFQYARDPDDEPYLNLAIEAGADFIVTRDHDLLDLARWDTEHGRDFQKRFSHIHIVDPVAFLELLREEDARTE